ncbi:Cyclin-dependent kinase inhibitor 1B [Papilio machaon]|uniref:Cyclin-dependent kinase inhibitor 1B n=1 Tax=Papilio machaon TaxID=76193 RepID=A0A194R8B3_PAPMA|nr:Cyclin-dependent kinase inhibitor 1B [Papilio machaon]
MAAMSSTINISSVLFAHRTFDLRAKETAIFPISRFKVCCTQLVTLIWSCGDLIVLLSKYHEIQRHAVAKRETKERVASALHAAAAKRGQSDACLDCAVENLIPQRASRMRSGSAFALCSAVQLDSVSKMSTLSVRAPGIQATTMLDTRSLRVRGVTNIDTVRRNLFGCTDREENRRFVERELARQLELDSQRWGFDFANEKPLPGPQRFAWQLVPISSIPVALRRAPITVATPKPNAPSQETQVASPENTKTQKRITGQWSTLIFIRVFINFVAITTTEHKRNYKNKHSAKRHFSSISLCC